MNKAQRRPAKKRTGNAKSKKAQPIKVTARSLALKLIGQVKGKRKPIEEILRSDPDYRSADPRDQSFTRSLVTHFFRHHHALDAAFAPYLSRGLSDLSPAAVAPLRLGTLELLVLRAEPHAALNECVGLAPKALRGLVNAVLRKLIASQDEAQDRFDKADALPPWMAETWTHAFGADRTANILAGLRQVPDLDLSLKPGADAPAELGESLAPNHRRTAATDPRTLPGFDAGDWWVQDLAASLPVRLLGEIKDARVLDVCAAPGGKTMQLAAAGAHVTALDLAEHRIRRMSENLDRTGLDADLVCSDALTYEPDDQFDAIFLDAPCSASGTLRRHPEWPWIHARKDQLANVPLQAKMIRKALTWLKPGGILVYAVCSLFPEEGEMQIEALMKDETGLELISAKPKAIPTSAWDTKKGWLRATPNPNLNMDGFFAAALKKKA